MSYGKNLVQVFSGNFEHKTSRIATIFMKCQCFQSESDSITSSHIKQCHEQALFQRIH